MTLITLLQGKHIMKMFSRHAVILLAAAIACQAGIALSDTSSLAFLEGQATAPAANENLGANQPGPCVPCSGQTPLWEPTGGSCSSPTCGPCNGQASGSCGGQTYGSRCDQACGGDCCHIGCDECPGFGIVGFAGLDSFKGISDGHFQSNFGAVTGLNAAMPVPGLNDYGIGWQLGMSYGVYDFDGWGDGGASIRIATTASSRSSSPPASSTRPTAISG